MLLVVLGAMDVHIGKFYTCVQKIEGNKVDWLICVNGCLRKHFSLHRVICQGEEDRTDKDEKRLKQIHPAQQ